MLLSQSLRANESDAVLADYIKTCEVTKLNLGSCESRFYKLNEQRVNESFWQSTEGEITKFIVALFVGYGSAKILDGQR